MEKSIEEKLSEIKAINHGINEVELAMSRHAQSKEINWHLLTEDVKSKIHKLVYIDYGKTKAELIIKAKELMK